MIFSENSAQKKIKIRRDKNFQRWTYFFPEWMLISYNKVFFTAQARKRENSKKNSRKDVGCFCMSLTPLVLEFMTKINARQSALSLQITHSFKSLNRKRYVVVFYVSINLIRVIPLLRSEKKSLKLIRALCVLLLQHPWRFEFDREKKRIFEKLYNNIISTLKQLKMRRIGLIAILLLRKVYIVFLL